MRRVEQKQTFINFQKRQQQQRKTVITSTPLYCVCVCEFVIVQLYALLFVESVEWSEERDNSIVYTFKAVSVVRARAHTHTQTLKSDCRLCHHHKIIKYTYCIT